MKQPYRHVLLIIVDPNIKTKEQNSSIRVEDIEKDRKSDK